MRTSGITSTTPEEISQNAAVVFKNLKYVYTKVEVEDDGDAPEGALKVVADGTKEDEKTIQLKKLKNHGVSFIGLAEGYDTPNVGDYVIGAWDDSEGNVLCATSGGTKAKIVSEFLDIDVDGAYVKVSGFKVKTGEQASIEANMLNQSVESLKRAIVGKEVEDGLIKGFTQIETKPLLELSDYLSNIGYVYRKSNGKMVIIIMENVICSSGFETENKNKDAAVTPITFECTADFKSGKYDTLPVYIFYED